MQQDKRARPASCLCGQLTQDVQLDPSNDTQMLNLCHCYSCQAVSGQLCTTYYLLQTEPQGLGRLERYEQSGCVSRYFCGTCGSQAFAHSTNTGKYFVASGLVDSPPPTVSVRHWRATDTRDGGLTSFLPGASGDDVEPCFISHGLGGAQQGVEMKPTISNQDSHDLLARCHCGGIELYITRPNSKSSEPWSPWPDLVIPYHSGNWRNAEDVKWWLRDGNTKYMAGTCACRSCRLASGFPIQTWAFIPKSNILTATKSPLAFGEGTMKQYESSPKVYREFCSRCGASVFWHCEERPLLLDVSCGLLQAESGSRAEDWLDWVTGRTSFAELAADVPLIDQLEAGLRAWGLQKEQDNI